MSGITGTTLALLALVLAGSTLAEKFLTVTDSTTYARFGHAAVPALAGDGFLMFGGYSNVPATFATSDVFVYSMNTTSWSTISFAGGTPSPSVRAFHSWTKHDADMYAFLYGGHLTDGSTSKEAWVFDYQLLTWYAVGNPGNNAPQVGQHSTVYDSVANRFIVHGGVNLKSPSSPVIEGGTYSVKVSLNFQSGTKYVMTITRLAAAATIATYAHSATFITDKSSGDTMMIAYGGHSSYGNYPPIIAFQLLVCVDGSETQCTWSQPDFSPTLTNTGRVSVSTWWNVATRELTACSGLAAQASAGTMCQVLYIPTSSPADWTTAGSAWRTYSVTAYTGMLGANMAMVPVSRYDGAKLMVRHGGATRASGSSPNTILLNMDYTILYVGTAGK